MNILKGKFNTARIYAQTLEDEVVEQIKNLCDREEYIDSKIAMMPDAHSGKGCTIGTVMTINDAICPNLLGVDIGCGVNARYIPKELNHNDLVRLDEFINQSIPAGFEIYNSTQVAAEHSGYQKMRAEAEENFYKLSSAFLSEFAGEKDYDVNSLGTLGGGNHFIAVEGNYLVIHTGSRKFGKMVAEFWQKKAVEQRGEKSDFAYLTGSWKGAYVNDMRLAQNYARQNRRMIELKISEYMGWNLHRSTIESVHNYLDHTNVLRKGAISAHANQQVIIPLNMADGSLIGVGKGNEDWLYSAPHGAGRTMSRKKAKKEITLSSYENAIAERGIYSTSVSKETLDEAPMAYKNADEIKAAILDTVEILEHIAPKYNFKAH